MAGPPKRVVYVFNLSEPTYMAQLTLNVDATVVTRAKRFAARRGTSVSRLVERFLNLISRATSSAEIDAVPPILEELRSELRGKSADPSAYRKYLERKYR